MMGCKPLFAAPNYRGSGKLQGLTALITGGDSGILAAPWPCCLPAKGPMLRLPI